MTAALASLTLASGFDATVSDAMGGTTFWTSSSLKFGPEDPTGDRFGITPQVLRTHRLRGR
jgi:hypothetical protein